MQDQAQCFGKVKEVPQTEETPFHPRSSYGISKVTGFYLTMNYREAYKLFALSGILYNHESPRRGYEFVTRKISSHVAKIKLGKTDVLRLGNLDAIRDWGYAPDYVEAMWLMLQQQYPNDYVIATGEAYSVREFCDLAFKTAGLDYRDYVVVDPLLVRPAEVEILLGDATKAKQELNWNPTISFQQLVKDMVNSDIEIEKNKK